MKRLRNISRIDTEANRTHAWQLRLQRCNDVIFKTFSDALHGGKRKSLNAALEYRDALLLQNSPFEHQVWVRTRHRKNNTSGIVGVARYDRSAKSNIGRGQAFWQAAWVDENGASRKRKFSVSLHGEHQAKHLAIAERERQLKLVCAIKAGHQEAQPGGRPRSLRSLDAAR